MSFQHNINALKRGVYEGPVLVCVEGKLEEIYLTQM